MEYDINSNMKIVPAGHSSLGAWIQSAGTATGSTVDRRGFNTAFFVVDAGRAAGTISFEIEHSDDGDAWSSVPSSEIRNGGTGTAGEVGTATAIGVFTETVLNSKRYMRLIYVGSGGASYLMGSVAVLTDPIQNPVPESHNE